jgi:hypothetical protein
MKENELLFYINNYHFKNGNTIYITCKINEETTIYYDITIYANEYTYKKSFLLRKSEIRDNKLNKLGI